MARRKQPAGSNKIFLKISSLVMGAMFWYLWSGIYPITRDVTVPLTFYNVPEGMVVACQDELAVQLRATRPAFLALDAEQLIVHVDAHRFVEGPNGLTIGADSLFLPDNIRLVDYTPSNVVAFMGAERVHELDTVSTVRV